MIAPRHSSTSQTSAIAPEFGTSADGFPVARIGDTLLALLPTRDGSFFSAAPAAIFGRSRSFGGITSTAMMAAKRTRRHFANGCSRHQGI